MPARYYQEIDNVGGAPLRRELSIRTASDAVTIPDNPGPGHTLDKALVWGGALLERAVTWLSVRAGRGPLRPTEMIMRAVYHSWSQSRTCRNSRCNYRWKPACHEMTAPPPADDLAAVCEWLAYATRAAPSCPKCGLKQYARDISTEMPAKSSKKLIALLRSTNTSSRYISTQLVALLAMMYPGFLEADSQRGAASVLMKLSQTMADELDLDPILAPSRRALVCLADAEVLSLGKQLDAMIFMGASGWKPIMLELLVYFSDPEKELLALTIAHRRPWLLDARDIPVLTTLYTNLWSQLAVSDDPVEVAVVTECLLHIMEYQFYIYSSWLIPILKARPEFLEHVPPRLRTAVEKQSTWYEHQAIAGEGFYGRRVNKWRREIWRYDPHDPEGEPNDDRFFKMAARDDGKEGYAKIDRVWWEVPVWETDEGRKWMVTGASTRAEEAVTEEGGRRRREHRRRRRARGQSLDAAVRICTLRMHSWDESERSDCPMRHDYSLHAAVRVAKTRKRSRSVV